MRNVALTIAYDGTNYSGWQIQKNAITVQGVIQKVLSNIVQHNVRLKVAGRTDTGVHAVGQVASFRTTSRMSPHEFKEALNSMLPADIRVLGVEDVDEEFHPRYSAKKRWYRYLIYNVEVPSPFFRNYSLWVRKGLDVELLNRYAKVVEGEHDFTSLAMLERGNSPVRIVYSCEVKRRGDFVVVDIVANSFLRRMVRSIVGTFLDLEKNSMPPEEMEKIIFAKERRLAGQTAYPNGLYLMKVFY